MNTLKESEKNYMQLQEKTNEIISTVDSLRGELVKKAQGEIQRIIRNSAELQNYYGLFADGKMEWNADSVGAYNILRLYRDRTEKIIHMEAIKPPYVMKVAV